MGPAGPIGPQGLQGPAGPSGVVATSYANGAVVGISDGDSYQFVSPTVTIVVDVGQDVFVSSEAGLGSALLGAGNLKLSICYQQDGDAPIDNGADGIGNLQVAPSTLQIFALSTRFAGLDPGVYQFGLCGYADGSAFEWDNNDWSRVTALLLTPSE
jgi:hypothetical protein